MIDVETFFTTLYVMIDDFCQLQPETAKAKPGPQASLSQSEVITLAVFGQLAGLADIGWSNRIGWYEGFHLLLSVTDQGEAIGRTSSRLKLCARSSTELRSGALCAPRGQSWRWCQS